MRPRLLALLALLAGAAHAGAAPQPAPQLVTVQLDCSSLTSLLRSYIGTRTDLFMHYNADNCLTSSLMQMFLRETTAVLPVHPAPPRLVNATLAANSQALAEVLVLALIGRHYTARFAAGQFFFEYDPATQILTPRMPRCEYQRSFLVLLLFVSIVLLVFALVTQSLTQAEAARAAARPPVPSAPTLQELNMPRSTNIASGSMQQHLSIDFAHLRRARHAYAPLV